MTGDIINLRTARKRLSRADKERQAKENRRTFGQTKSERIERKAELERKAQTLDGHLRIHKESVTADQPDNPDVDPETILGERDRDKDERR